MLLGAPLDLMSTNHPNKHHQTSSVQSKNGSTDLSNKLMHSMRRLLYWDWEKGQCAATWVSFQSLKVKANRTKVRWVMTPITAKMRMGNSWTQHQRMLLSNYHHHSSLAHWRLGASWHLQTRSLNFRKAKQMTF